MTATAAPDRAGTTGRDRLLTRDFVLVCITSLACYIGFQLLLPTLPLYMKSLGGQDAEIGLILGIYSISVLAARFLAGWALDRWGRRWVLVTGAFLFMVAMLLYGAATTVPSLLALRLFHGLGFGLVTTTCSALVADLAPPSRRGEALGYFGNFSSVALALGPGIALWLMSAPGLPFTGFAMVFAGCALAGVIQLLLSFFVGETRTGPRSPTVAAAVRSSSGLLSRGALPFAYAMFFGAFATGAILSFVPIHLSVEAPQNVGLFFFTYAVTMTVSRPFIGIITDRIQRHLVVLPLSAICAVGVGILAISPSLLVVATSAIVCGIGFGSLQPTLLAIVVDVTEPRERGAALATFMSSIDVGIAVGSTALGLVAQATGYRSLFLMASGVMAIGFIYFLLYQRSPYFPRMAPAASRRPRAAPGE